MGRFDKFRKRKDGKESPAPVPGARYNDAVDSGTEGDRSGGTISFGQQSTSSKSFLTSFSTSNRKAARMDKENMRKQQEIMGEQAAMKIFQRNISETHAAKSYSQHHQRALGWDYINWKPYGWHRYEYNPDDYQQRCQALAPYVRSVLISGCEGVHEKRWENLTSGKGEEGLYSRTMSQSRLGLSGSQGSLSHVGRI